MDALTNEAQSSWPEFFPQDVPPSHSVAAKGQVYRLVDTIPPSAADFRPAYQETPQRNFGQDLWKACGLSFHRDLEDSRRTRSRYKALRQKHIVVGVLVPSFGRMLSTPSVVSPSHVTVWLYRDALLHPHFATTP